MVHIRYNSRSGPGFDAGEYPDVETMEEQDRWRWGRGSEEDHPEDHIRPAVEETRPILTALFEIEDKSSLGVLDGYRLGWTAG